MWVGLGLFLLLAVPAPAAATGAANDCQTRVAALAPLAGHYYATLVGLPVRYSLLLPDDDTACDGSDGAALCFQLRGPAMALGPVVITVPEAVGAWAGAAVCNPAAGPASFALVYSAPASSDPPVSPRVGVACVSQ
jgi:hypothetical protein